MIEIFLYLASLLGAGVTTDVGNAWDPDGKPTVDYGNAWDPNG